MSMRVQIAIIMTLFSVLVSLNAGIASAETTLLALWLSDGAEVILEPATIEGEILLEDTDTIAGKSAVICSDIVYSTINSDGGSTIYEVLNLKGEKIELGIRALLGTGLGTGSDCKTETGCTEGTAASPIEVYPIGLPWVGLLFLMENGQVLDLISAVETGYELLCLILGINAEDRCTAADQEVLIENNATTGDAFTPAKSASVPNANCTQSGGMASGVDETATVLAIVPAVGLLTVSSE